MCATPPPDNLTQTTYSTSQASILKSQTSKLIPHASHTLNLQSPALTIKSLNYKVPNPNPNPNHEIPNPKCQNPNTNPKISNPSFFQTPAITLNSQALNVQAPAPTLKPNNHICSNPNPGHTKSQSLNPQSLTLTLKH